MDTLDNWPPVYTVKRSTRARYARLRICQYNGLEIIIPKRFNLNNIPLILQEKRNWILQHLPKNLEALSNDSPTELNFAAINEIWKITYTLQNTNKISLKQENFNLHLIGDIDNKELVKKILLKFLNLKATQSLLPWLKEVSLKANLPYTKASVRYAKMRWGSCNAEKSISLNCKLLFLPKNLTEHILLHELCHTIHLNHSKNFWQLLAKLDENFLLHDKLLRKMNLPNLAWLEK